MLKLEKEISSCKFENSTLGEKLERTVAELSEETASRESFSITCNDLKKKLCESEKLRRQLHNTVQDLKVSTLPS